MVLTLAAAPTGGRVVAAEQTMTPMERVASTPKGQLKSPYADFASVAEEGHRKYMAAGCNGCHGGGGGGGMAAPLTNPVWIYGDDDDTLFRLITLGTGKRWSRFLRQAAKVDSPMKRMIHHEDAQTVHGRVQGEGRA